jgi:hypothetical protein
MIVFLLVGVSAAPVGGDAFPERLFDIRLELQNTLLSQASDFEAMIGFFSFGTVPTSVDLTYVILDDKGNEIYREAEHITVTTQEVLIKTLGELELPEGKYVFVLNTLYGDDVFDEFSQNFEIIFEKKISLWFWVAGGIATIGLITGLILWLLRRRKRRESGRYRHSRKLNARNRKLKRR